MKQMKKWLIGIFVMVLSFSMVACSGEQNSEKEVIATVNGEKIYQSDYDALYDEYFNYFGATDEAAAYLTDQKQLILDELISNKVLMQKAKELNIKCSENEINEAYKAIELQYGQEAVQQMLEAANMDEKAYKQMIKEQLILSKLQKLMIDKEIKVTDEMLQTYYNEHIAYYTTGAGAKMKHILVRVPEDASKEQIDEAEKAVKQIQDELVEGKSFDELYVKYLAESEGSKLYIVEDLGFVPYEDARYDQAFLAGVRNVKEGEVSEPIKSSFGYHFVKVTDISEPVVKTLDEVKEQVTVAVKEQEEYNLYATKLKEWMEQANIVTYEERMK